MRNTIRQIQDKFTPLQIILALGILFRLIAVIFSKGFGWFDDHFLVIEASQSWVDGYDYNYWLPDPDFPDRQPQGHPLFYVGIHYYIFKLFAFLGLNDPQLKMLFIRLIHAAWSVLIIIYGYRIAEHLSDKRTAIYTAAFLSLFWFMPFLSVRNLAEFVCIPPLLIATGLILKNNSARTYFLAGIWFGIAVSLRLQSIFYISGIGLAWLIQKNNFKSWLYCGLGFLTIISLTNCLVDLIIWGKPFAELSAYIKHNIENANSYTSSPWHSYFDIIFGILIPPLSILLVVGWMKIYRRIPILFWPILIYLLFHTFFPNKQERFAVTIIPPLIIAGTIGMFSFYENLKARSGPALWTSLKLCILLLNFLLLCAASTAYSKKNRVEAMRILHEQADLKMVMIENSNRRDFTMPPLYYLGKWHPVLAITQKYNIDVIKTKWDNYPDSIRPNYVVFWQSENINERLDNFKKVFPDIQFVAEVEPGILDRVLHRLNPKNDNETAYIYKLNE